MVWFFSLSAFSRNPARVNFLVTKADMNPHREEIFLAKAVLSVKNFIADNTVWHMFFVWAA
jgi:hypothetical protein